MHRECVNVKLPPDKRGDTRGGSREEGWRRTENFFFFFFLVGVITEASASCSAEHVVPCLLLPTPLFPPRSSVSVRAWRLPSLSVSLLSPSSILPVLHGRPFSSSSLSPPHPAAPPPPPAPLTPRDAAAPDRSPTTGPGRAVTSSCVSASRRGGLVCVRVRGGGGGGGGGGGVCERKKCVETGSD